MRQLILILKRQKPHLILFMVLSVLSGLAYALGPAESSAMEEELARSGLGWLLPAWALALSFSGLAGLGGIIWQRWRVERGMLMERGALLIQAGAVVLYGGLLMAALGWGATISAGAAITWAGANVWEASLIRRDLHSIEEARRG